MEGEQFFYIYEYNAILWEKLRGWLLAGKEIYELCLVASKYLKNIT